MKIISGCQQIIPEAPSMDRCSTEEKESGKLYSRTTLKMYLLVVVVINIVSVYKLPELEL